VPFVLPQRLDGIRGELAVHNIIMRQAATVGAQVYERRVMQEIRDAAGIDIRVALHLAGKVAFVFPGTHEQAPVRIHHAA